MALGDPNALIQTGVLGIVLAWFMFRLEKIVAANTEALQGVRLVLESCKKAQSPA